MSQSTLPIIDVKKKKKITFVNYFYQSAPEINPQDVNEVFGNA